jgi:nucleotide-binding universal stress UspA family protein
VIEIRRILCPTDFSDASRHALDFAAAIARWYGSTITVLHVSPVQPVYAFGAAVTVLPAALLSPVERERLLATMKQSVELELGSSVPFATELIEGSPPAAILERADTLPSDLIVVGTHGLSGFDRLVLGSVTEKVLRKAVCPVLTVPPQVPDAVPVPSALFRRILCAVDFSECSMQALTYALSIAQEANAHLLVVNVLERLIGDEPPPPSPAVRGYFELVEADRRLRLAEAVPESAKAFCTVETRYSEGRAHRAILRIAAEDKSDLIVMGVRGRGAVDRWVFGSTAEQVVRQATCPVLTLRKG